jgi:hypothetical protein
VDLTCPETFWSAAGVMNPNTPSDQDKKTSKAPQTMQQNRHEAQPGHMAAMADLAKVGERPQEASDLARGQNSRQSVRPSLVHSIASMVWILTVTL